MRCTMSPCILAACLLGCAGTPATPEPALAPESIPASESAPGPAGSGPVDAARWQAAIDEEAARLGTKYPGARVRMLAVDLDSGEVLGHHGDVVSRYATGSTIKTLVVLAALRLGLDPATSLDCSGPVTIDGMEIRDAGSNGTLTPAGVLVYSSNIGVARITEHVPWDALLTEVRTMVPLDDADEQLAGVSLLVGLTSRLSLRELVAGYRAAWTDPEHGAFVRDALEQAVGPDGTGSRAAVEASYVAGKTGTELVEGRIDALFVGIAGRDQPQTVVAIAVGDLPEGTGYGGSIAAPAFARIVETSQR